MPFASKAAGIKAATFPVAFGLRAASTARAKTTQGRPAVFQPTPRRHRLKDCTISCGPQGLSGLSIRITGVATVFADEEAKLSWLSMPKAAFYAVASGREPGIYSTWAEAERQVKGYPAAKYKKFGSRAEADAFVGNSTPYSKAPDSQQAGSSRASKVVSDHLQPLTQADPSTLPPQLKRVAERGFSFTAEPHYLIVYTDGSSINNGKANARAGLGVYYGSRGQAADSNIAERLPGPTQTNNRGELLSVIRAIEGCPYPDLPLQIRTDSQYAIKCITIWLPKWLSKNFAGVMNSDLIKHLCVLMRRRGKSNGVKFRFVPGHSGEAGNEAADQLARQGAGMDRVPDRTDWLDPDDDDVSPLNISQVEVELDESWLLTEDELTAFEGR